MTRKPINIARESVGLLFCQREGLESEWCVIHGSTWAPPHEKCCVEGERTVRRIAQAIEAYATEVAELVRAETLAGFTEERQVDRLGPCFSHGLDPDAYHGADCRFRGGETIRRRLIGPWEQVEP